ncbi:MAG TPA: response regulator [Thioalkalivibrio sp.]|nr:response regulator [Thioalkalivibrio sp.]
MTRIRRLEPDGLHNAAIPVERADGAPRTRQIAPLARQHAYVVVVDDQLTGRRILEELLHTLDDAIEVEGFADAQAALDRIAQRVPDLIVSDCQMPGMDGLRFVRELRRLPECRHVPLVMVTVMDDRRIRQAALDAGVTDFLTRPVDPHECRARCRNLLALRRQQTLLSDRSRWLEDQVAVAVRETHTRECEALLRLARAGEYRGESGGNHIHRIARYARLIAEGLGLPVADCIEIELAAPLHDVGKAGLPDSVLLKQGSLTAAETEIMQSHTVIGYEILKDSPSRYIRRGAEIALGHHEHYDGTGYPNGLGGEEIPLAARIVAVADMFDELTAKRPHKTTLTLSEAAERLRQLRGRALDPACVDAFLQQVGRVRAIQQDLADDASR